MVSTNCPTATLFSRTTPLSGALTSTRAHVAGSVRFASGSDSRSASRRSASISSGARRPARSVPSALSSATRSLFTVRSASRTVRSAVPLIRNSPSSRWYVSSSVLSFDTASTNSLFFAPRSALHTTASTSPLFTRSPTFSARRAVTGGETGSADRSGSGTCASSTTGPGNGDWTRASWPLSKLSVPWNEGSLRLRLGAVAGADFMPSDARTSAGTTTSSGPVRRSLGAASGSFFSAVAGVAGRGLPVANHAAAPPATRTTTPTATARPTRASEPPGYFRRLNMRYTPAATSWRLCAQSLRTEGMHAACRAFTTKCLGAELPGKSGEMFAGAVDSARPVEVADWSPGDRAGASVNRRGRRPRSRRARSSAPGRGACAEGCRG